MSGDGAGGDLVRANRRPARIAILSHGTSEFDSRAQRIARSCADAGDTVTIYSRYLRGLPTVESLDGYRIVRLPLSRNDQRSADADAAAGPDARSDTGGTSGMSGTPGKPDTGQSGPALSRDPLSRIMRAARATRRRLIKRIRRAIRISRERANRLPDRIPTVRRFRSFPWQPMRQAAWFERQVEPHDIWHGMWAWSLPTLSQVQRRHGGATVYDARDVFLRSRSRASTPGWERRILTWYERRWAHAADATIQVSEPYASMMQRDLGLGDIPVVRNCPDRWDPPEPRPDRIRQSLGIPAGTAVVLYQGLVMSDRGIEQAMDAILEVPDAVLVIMGPGNHLGSGSSRQLYVTRSHEAPWAGKVHVIDAVPPAQLLYWSASSDVMVMPFQPDTENHRYVTPQKMWEAMAAGVPVVASDLPGMAPIVTGTGCGLVCDPTSPTAIAAAIRQLLGEGPEGLRARGWLGWQAAQQTYNWSVQFDVLDSVYAQLLAER